MNTLFVVIVLLNIADAATTMYALKRGATEKNPIMRAVMKKIKQPELALALVKIPLLVLIYFFIQDTTMLAILAATFAGVVGWNLYQIKKNS